MMWKQFALYAFCWYLAGTVAGMPCTARAEEPCSCDEDGADSCLQDDEAGLLQTSLRTSGLLTDAAHMVNHERSQIAFGLEAPNSSATQVSKPKLNALQLPARTTTLEILPVKDFVDPYMVVSLAVVAIGASVAYKLSVSDLTVEPRKVGLYAEGMRTITAWCVLALLAFGVATLNFYRFTQLGIWTSAVTGLAVWIWLLPIGIVLCLTASLGILTNSRISSLSKNVWLFMLATCWVVMIVAGVALARGTLRCGVIFCVGTQPSVSAYASFGLELILTGTVFLVGLIVMYPRMEQVVVRGDSARRRLSRKATELRCGLCLSLLVLPLLFLLTTILPTAFYDFSPATISANLATWTDTAEFPYAWLKTMNVRLSENAVMKFFPDIVIYYLFLEILAITAVAANIFPSLGGYLNQKRDPTGFTNGEKIGMALFSILLFLFVRYWLVDHSYHDGKEALSLWWSERIARTWGQTAVLFMSLLLLPASKNSLWLKCMGISWERSLWLHQTLGYASLVCMAGHMLSFWVRFAELRCFPYDAFATVLYYPVNSPTLTRSATPNYDNWTLGMMQMVGYPALFMISFGVVIRHKNWELFKYFHYVFLALIPAVLLHSSSALCFMLGGIAFWLVDAAIRFATVVTPPALLLENGIVTHPAEGGFTELHMNWTHAEPGQFAWLKVPCISAWEWHPFSLSSGIDDGYAQMCIKNMGPGSWTDKLYQLGKEANQSAIMFDIQVDGPYGPYLQLDTHAACLLIAGGIGITQVHSIFRSVAQLIKRKESFAPELKSVHLVWVGKTREIFRLFSESIKNCINCSTDRVQLRASFFQTQRTLSGEDGSLSTFSPEIKFTTGRPKFEELYADEAQVLGGKSLLVQACGPEAMIEAVADAARGNEQVVFESMLFKL